MVQDQGYRKMDFFPSFYQIMSLQTESVPFSHEKNVHVFSYNVPMVPIWDAL